MSQNYQKNSVIPGATFVTAGAATGAGVSAAVGGMGLVGGFGAVGLGMAPVTVAGAVAGAAAYGAFTAIGEGDTFALGAIGIGAAGGASFYSVFGGMGLAFKGTAVGIGMAPMTAVGAVIGLGIYGLHKALKPEPGERLMGAIDAFGRMEEKILWQDAYILALIELDAELSGEILKQKFIALQIDTELEELKAKMQPQSNSNFHKLNVDSSVNSETSATRTQLLKSKFSSPEIEAKLVRVEVQASQSWKCLHTLKGHSGSVNSVAISLDGEILASGSDDRTVTLWNLKTGKKIFTFIGQAQEVYSVAISPDSKTLVSGSFDQKITSWNLRKNEFIRTFFYLNSPYSHSGFVYSVAFSPDGKIIASGSADKTIRLWNGYGGKLIRTINGHSDAVLSVAISPDSQTIASGSADKTIRLWNLIGGQEHHILAGHSGWVNSVAFSPDGKTLASGSGDTTIKFWNLKTGELIRTFSGHSSGVNSIAFSPDGKTFASGSTNSVKIWNLHTGELLETLSGRGAVAFSADGNSLVSGANGGTIKIWHQSCETNKSQSNFVLSGEWWEVLGVEKGAYPKDVKRAYIRLGRQYHPDINSSASAKATMQAINQAYDQYRKEISGNTVRLR